ncbi:hypothetical protein BO82DRAFT_38893 [Aspergillus uvarum CBS 121591]|uniref:Uncharacterized protein n=1 Tax=Aspergillus uvarum CBS 121591 TaxID=1448315 RepID=A0A319CD11_9EURO|nr:hypothetical protein BO82DRAFT_38893 [Aspergillus uvarum CBS 121591]PYH83696.1 hypothetical protein BO82DRAFT_38893 [Aspergillus uvarum CBS 121591]
MKFARGSSSFQLRSVLAPAQLTTERNASLGSMQNAREIYPTCISGLHRRCNSSDPLAAYMLKVFPWHLPVEAAAWGLELGKAQQSAASVLNVSQIRVLLDMPVADLRVRASVEYSRNSLPTFTGPSIEGNTPFFDYGNPLTKLEAATMQSILCTIPLTNGEEKHTREL